MKHSDLLGGLDYLTANYVKQDFPRHAHGEYLIGFIESGVHDVWCKGEWWHAAAGTIATFAPDEPHYGGAGHDGGWRQTIFYFPESLVHNVLQEQTSKAACGFGIRSPFHQDDGIAKELKHIWRLLEVGSPALEIEEKLHEVLILIFQRFGELKATSTDVTPGDLAKVRDYIHEHTEMPIQLGELADLSGQSKRQLIEGFKRFFGITPHRYLIQTRIEQAKNLLKAGADVAEAAAATGFADQSHLTRHFRSILGVTPARYVRAET